MIEIDPEVKELQEEIERLESELEKATEGDPESEVNLARIGELETVLEAVFYWFDRVLTHNLPPTDPRIMMRDVEDVLR